LLWRRAASSAAPTAIAPPAPAATIEKTISEADADRTVCSKARHDPELTLDEELFRQAGIGSMFGVRDWLDRAD
jgi:hypothetical protein